MKKKTIFAYESLMYSFLGRKSTLNMLLTLSNIVPVLHYLEIYNGKILALH